MDPLLAPLIPVLRLKYNLRDRELKTQGEVEGQVSALRVRANSAGAKNLLLTAEHDGQEVFVLITTRPKQAKALA